MTNKAASKVVSRNHLWPFVSIAKDCDGNAVEIVALNKD